MRFRWSNINSWWILESMYAIFLSGCIGALNVVSVEHVLDIDILAIQPMKRINPLSNTRSNHFMANELTAKSEFGEGTWVASPRVQWQLCPTPSQLDHSMNNVMLFGVGYNYVGHRGARCRGLPYMMTLLKNTICCGEIPNFSTIEITLEPCIRTLKCLM